MLISLSRCPVTLMLPWKYSSSVSLTGLMLWKVDILVPIWLLMLCISELYILATNLSPPLTRAPDHIAILAFPRNFLSKRLTPPFYTSFAPLITMHCKSRSIHCKYAKRTCRDVIFIGIHENILLWESVPAWEGQHFLTMQCFGAL